GWEAQVDGRKTSIQIVDGFLRGVFIDGVGQHRIEMSFHPWAPKYGALATLAGIALLLGSRLLQRRGQREREFEAEIPAGGRNVAVRE
ncbi:MAG TPA: hypothetical protein VG168_02765, partial [Bryobacteraceae bacterium]|nr:hypothetical protein [Bryobacteraceae bacterium]